MCTREDDYREGEIRLKSLVFWPTYIVRLFTIIFLTKDRFGFGKLVGWIVGCEFANPFTEAGSRARFSKLAKHKATRKFTKSENLSLFLGLFF